MIKVNCDPVGHIPPRPRIDLERHKPLPDKIEGLSFWEKHHRQSEIDRIW
jgi:hypothetical protein